MYLGKQIRMRRIIDSYSKRTIIVPMDHGITLGPIDGLVDVRKTMQDMVEGGANALILHKGLMSFAHELNNKDLGLIMHLSASTILDTYNNSKVLVSTVEEAICHGADCVSVHLNIGNMNESSMLKDVGRVSATCERFGMPLLIMVYARGPQIVDEYALEHVAHCARVGMELGADMVKVVYSGSVETFAQVIDSCAVPVVIAGGEEIKSTFDILQMAQEAIIAGATGLSVGRNVFQHSDRINLVRALSAIVHDNADVDTALDLVENI